MALSAKRPSQKEQLLHDVKSADEPKKRLNADVEASLYRRMREQALREDSTVSEITRRLWIEYLSANSGE
jgi:hypothetical protein